MRVVQVSSGIDHLIIADIDRCLVEAGHEAALFIPRTTEHLSGRIPGRVHEEPTLADGSPQGQRDAAAAVRDFVALWRADVLLFHEPWGEALLRALSDVLPVCGFIHNVICPGQKLFRRGDRVCTRAMDLGCLWHWYAGPCGSDRAPQVAMRHVLGSIGRRAALRRLPAVLVGSAFMKSHLVVDGFDPTRVHVIDVCELLHLPADQTQRPAVRGASAATILCVGRLVYNKGVHHLLRAAAVLQTLEGFEDVRLVVVGDGYYRGRLEALAAELRLRNVHFTGWLEQGPLANWYEKADLVVVPSIWPEPLGFVVAEAARHGVPSLVSDRGALPEWRRALTGIDLVDVCDVDALVAALAQKLGQTGATVSLVPEASRVQPEPEPVLDVLARVVTRQRARSGG